MLQDLLLNIDSIVFDVCIFRLYSTLLWPLLTYIVCVFVFAY